jgi:hypothetical protein
MNHLKLSVTVTPSKQLTVIVCGDGLEYDTSLVVDCGVSRTAVVDFVCKFYGLLLCYCERTLIPVPHFFGHCLTHGEHVY